MFRIWQQKSYLILFQCDSLLGDDCTLTEKSICTSIIRKLTILDPDLSKLNKLFMLLQVKILINDYKKSSALEYLFDYNFSFK